MNLRLRRSITAIFFAALTLSVATALPTDYYVDARNGSDAAVGTSPDAAWKTLARVSQAEEIQPGDVVRFHAGDVWRESLAPRSGDEGRPVTYTSYGEGAKPSFWRSVSLSDEDAWVKEGENIWATRPRTVTPFPDGIVAKLIPGRWATHAESGASVNYVEDSGSFKLEIKASGSASNHIQWMYDPFTIKRDRSIRCSFSARASQPTTFNISLMASSRPWPSYGAVSGLGEITTEFQRFELCLRPNRDAEDARLTFYLGVVPQGVVLEFADFTFEEVEIDEFDLGPDVGNIILDHNAAAFKRWELDELKEQDDYYYNRVDGRVWYYSRENPAAKYDSIEAAIMQHIVDLSGVHDAIFDGLDIRYGAAHGFGGSGNARCVIRNCDISWIGGGDQHRGGSAGPRTRYGNGIEFWASAQDHLVENCRLWEIYDAALTNQGSGTNVERNIVYRNNLIWNCEYSFEYWNRDETSVTENIEFVNNICLNAGWGWGYVQRPDPNGRCLMFYDNTAQTKNVVIKGNIFANAKDSLVRFDREWSPEGPKLDDNVYWQDNASVPYALWLKTKYDRDVFDAYKKAANVEENGRIEKVDVDALIPKDVR